MYATEERASGGASKISNMMGKEMAHSHEREVKHNMFILDQDKGLS